MNDKWAKTNWWESKNEGLHNVCNLVIVCVPFTHFVYAIIFIMFWVVWFIGRPGNTVF